MKAGSFTPDELVGSSRWEERDHAHIGPFSLNKYQKTLPWAILRFWAYTT